MKSKELAVWLLIPLAISYSTTNATHILGMPIGGISHGRVLAKLGRELARRGYKYTLVIPKYEERYFKKLLPNYDVQVYDTKFEESDVEDLFKDNIVDEMVDFTRVDHLFGTMCEELLSNKAYFDKVGQVDAVLCDLAALCCTVVADMLNVTRIDISTASFNDPLLPLIHGFPSPPAYVPQLLVPRPRKMSLLDRTKNTFLYLAGYATYYFVYIVRYKKLKKKYATNSQYKDWDSYMKSSGMLLMQTDFALVAPRPLPPSVQVVGAILPEEPRPLPKKFVDVMATESDVIIVSMGTLMKNFDRDGSYSDILATAFARISAVIIWKHIGKTPTGLGNNTNIFPWIPQNDLLGHPKVKLFVSHCGMNGMLEAAYHGVPVVALPIFGDQFINAQDLKDSGTAEIIKFNALNADDLTAAVVTILNQKSYRENAKRVSKKMRIPGCGGREGCVKLAADWVEYGIKTDGARHFRTEMDHLSVIQLYLIDVVLFMLAVLGVVGAGLVFTCKFLFRIGRDKSKRE